MVRSEHHYTNFEYASNDLCAHIWMFNLKENTCLGNVVGGWGFDFDIFVGRE